MGLTNSNFNFCFFIFSANFKIVKIYLTKFGEIKKKKNSQYRDFMVNNRVNKKKNYFGQIKNQITFYFKICNQFSKNLIFIGFLFWS